MTASRPRVARYTIDNCYDEALISVARAELNPGVERFGNDPDDWGDEEPLMITPGSFREVMQAPESTPTWASLRPGQVYLQGTFQIEGDPDEPSVALRRVRPWSWPPRRAP